MVLEPVCVPPHAAQPTAADDHLVDALGSHRPAIAGAQPQLWPPGLGVPRTRPDVPVEGTRRLVADLDDALLAVLAPDEDLPPPQIQIATLRIHRVVADARQLRQPHPGRLEDGDDRRIAPLGKRPALASPFQSR